MAAFCVPRHLAGKLKEAARSGEITASKLIDMTSDNRRDLFAKYVDLEMAKQINVGFSTAIIKNSAAAQKKALQDWTEKTFSGRSEKKVKADIYTKIAKLEEIGALTPKNEEAFLGDLVAAKLGATVTAAEAKIISEKAERLDALSQDESEYGTPTKEYFKVKRETEDYLQSLAPSGNLRVATSTIGRAMMLASIKSPLVNITANTVIGITEVFSRRLASLRVVGSNGTYARNYAKFVNEVYKDTGYDISRMMSLSEGYKIQGEEITHSQGSGAVRKFGRITEDIVFKKLMTAPDVAFSSFHFSDSANLASAKMAQSEGLDGVQAQARALEIFKDATRISPKTLAGELVRAQAVADAQYATGTDNTIASTTALKIRDVLNGMSGDVRIGDQVMPFVKTPASFIQKGVEYSGVLAPAELYLLPVALKQAKNGDRAALQKSMRRITRAGLGLTLAFVLVSTFEPEDFIGNWPVNPKEQELIDLGNATTNSIKIGGKWISLDYFGPLSAPVIGMLYAKKYGRTNTEKVIQGYKGVIEQSMRIPGFRDFSDIVSDVKRFTDAKQIGVGELTEEATNTVLNYVRSRTVPAIVNDVAKGTDTVVRKTTGDPLARIKASIPGLRQTLPEDYTIFGDTKSTEGFFSELLFGSRMKEANDSPIMREIEELERTGNLPAITDFAKTSSRAKALQTNIGEEKFDRAMRQYGQYFKEGFSELLSDSSYKELPPEDRAKEVNSVKEAAFEDMLWEYGYEEMVQ